VAPGASAGVDLDAVDADAGLASEAESSPEFVLEIVGVRPWRAGVVPA
jgi:hypothetical protein